MALTFDVPLPNHRIKRLNIIPAPKNTTNPKEVHEHRNDAREDPR